MDYREMGRRIAKRRMALGLKQAPVEETAGLGEKYLSSIETGKSIPSLDALVRLALALDTTPDAFLVGTAQLEGDDAWRGVAELLRGMSGRKLDLARTFLIWLGDQEM